MTKEEYNQRALEIMYNHEKGHQEYMMDVQRKFEICRDLLPCLEKYGVNLTHDIFKPWSSLRICYTMNEYDQWSISRTLWQLIEDIDEVIECEWKVDNMDTDKLAITAYGTKKNHYFSIEVTIFFKEAATCKIEYIEENVTVKKAVVKC